MKLLIIEDQKKIAYALKKGLEQESFIIFMAHDSQRALAEIENETFDVIIMDRMMPGGMDGADIIAIMRKNQDMTPVILLTAKDSIEQRVEGLDSGADDYLVKPFAFEELLARVRALARRPPRSFAPQLQYKDITLDPKTHAVTRGKKKIELSRKEFALLEYFMKNIGIVISKTTLIKQVWDYDADILPNNVEAFVAAIRKKLEKPFESKKIIKTIRGIGYKFGETNV